MKLLVAVATLLRPALGLNLLVQVWFKSEKRENKKLMRLTWELSWVAEEKGSGGVGN